MWKRANNVLATSSFPGHRIKALDAGDAKKLKYYLEFSGDVRTLSYSAKGIGVSRGERYDIVRAQKRPENTSIDFIWVNLTESAKQPIVLWDISKGQRTAWLVDMLTVVLFTAQLYIKKYFPEWDTEIPYAAPSTNSGTAALNAIRNRLTSIVYKQRSGPAEEEKYDVTFGMILYNIWRRFDTLEYAKVNQPSGLNPSSSIKTCSIYDLIYHDKLPAYELGSFLASSPPEWCTKISDKAKIIFCSGLGDVYTPEEPAGDGVPLAPRGWSRLIAPVRLLKGMTGNSSREGEIGPSWILGTFHSPPFIEGSSCKTKKCQRVNFILNPHDGEAERYAKYSASLKAHEDAVLAISMYHCLDPYMQGREIGSSIVSVIGTRLWAKSAYHVVEDGKMKPGGTSDNANNQAVLATSSSRPSHPPSSSSGSRQVTAQARSQPTQRSTHSQQVPLSHLPQSSDTAFNAQHIPLSRYPELNGSSSNLQQSPLSQWLQLNDSSLNSQPVPSSHYLQLNDSSSNSQPVPLAIRRRPQNISLEPQQLASSSRHQQLPERSSTAPQILSPEPPQPQTRSQELQQRQTSSSNSATRKSHRSSGSRR